MTQGLIKVVQRLFLALWPDDSVRRWLRALPAVSGRRVPPETWHVTLVFLGAVEAVRRQALEEDLAAVPGEPFRLVLDRRGHWRRGGITWLAAGDTPPALSHLQRRLADLAREHELALDRRPYLPHLTLARQAPPEPPSKIEPIEWEVNGFCLVRSHTLPAGPRYEVLSRWELG